MIKKGGFMQYPETRKELIKEQFFGTEINDPYRWLEDDHSEETQAWVKEQQAHTEQILNEYPLRSNILNEIIELNDYPKMTCPIKRGDWYYFSKNSGTQNQWVIYRKKELNSEEELFFDPNTLSEDGTTQASRVGMSEDRKLFFYRISKAGADDADIWIFDTKKKCFIEEKLLNARHTGVDCYKNGFIYSKYDELADNLKANKNQKVYYHQFGDAFENDQLIYEDLDHPLRYHAGWVSDDKRYMFIYVSEGTSQNKILFKSLEDEHSEFKAIFDTFDYNFHIFDANDPDEFYLHTNMNAENYQLIKVNLKNSEITYKVIIPEREYMLDCVLLTNHKLIVSYLKDVSSKIEVMDEAGNYLYDIEMPYQGTANFFNDKKEDNETWFMFTSYTRPSDYYHYDVEKNQLTFYYRNPIKADIENYTSEQIFYHSKDGTKVPMTLIYKKGLQKKGNNPAYLYAYGGFNHAIMPYFSEIRIPFLDRGGIYAIANIRGGNEYGEQWHSQGCLLNKQNVFDDFISAAEYLISEQYTCPNKLAIAGGSNGGLLVGAVMTQRPDLFRVALPMMGVLDMLRYHKFTCGWGWMVEYGNPDEEIHFKNLLSYSPIHNVREDVKYPATMVVTADHDDRVIPGHSFKFAATLQEKGSKENPLLLYTQIQSGHGASNLRKYFELNADCWSFVLKYLEIK